jgi:hypothetical protein
MLFPFVFLFYRAKPCVDPRMGLCNFYLSLSLSRDGDNRKDKQQTRIIVLKGVDFTCYYFSSFDQDEKLQVKGWEL